MSSTTHRVTASPEEEARELHQQPVDRRVASLLLLVFLALLVWRPLQMLHSGKLRELSSAFGRDFDAAADDLEKESGRFTEPLVPGWQLVMARLGTGNESVLVGLDGWLEYRPAFDYVVGTPILDPDRLAKVQAGDPRRALRRFRADLRARGIELWVVPVPSKVMVHPESFARGLESRLDELDNPSAKEMWRELEALGLRILDPLPAMREIARTERAFLKTDSHWSPPSISKTAELLASAIEAEGILSPRDTDWRRAVQKINYGSDLSRMLHLRETAFFPPEPIEVPVVTTARGRLFKNDPQAEVLILGDSYSNIFAPRGGSFPAQLAYFLGRKVDRIAIDGGGATLNRAQLVRELRDNEHRLDTVKVVVLEFAVRELTAGHWQVIRLPPKP